MPEENEEGKVIVDGSANPDIGGDGGAPITNPETPPVDKKFTVPEGLDADLFDAEKQTIIQDKVIERLSNNKKLEESYKKQINDLRTVIAKGDKLPQSIEEYSKDYKPDEKYDAFYNQEEDQDLKAYVDMAMKTIDELSHSTAMTKDQNRAVKELFNKFAEDAGIFDLQDEATVEARKKAQDAWVEQEYAKLGTNAKEIVKANIKHYENFNVLNEAEREAVLSAMDKDINLVSAMNKIRILTHGEEAGQQSGIPTGVAVGGLADDNTLAAEYYNEKTTEARRIEILNQRRASGRPGKLPLVNF